MPQPKNTLLRVLVPLLIGAAGVGVVWSVMRNASPTPAQSAPVPGTAPANPPNTAATTPAAASAGASEPTASPGAPLPSTAPGSAQTPAGGATASVSGLKAKVWAGDPRTTGWGVLGGLDVRAGNVMRVEFSPSGAGVRSLRLAGHFTDLKNAEAIEIQRSVEPGPANGQAQAALVPMAALGLYINDQFVVLVGDESSPVWRGRDGGKPGEFEALIVNDAGEPVVSVLRTYTLRDGSYGLTLAQSATNLSASALKLRWMQLGPIDLAPESSSYGGDKRRVRFGYLHNPQSDPSRRVVMSNEFVLDHPALVGQPVNGVYPGTLPQWPNPESTTKQYSLVWTALTSRYFSIAVHQGDDPAGNPLRLGAFTNVDRVLLNQLDPTTGKPAPAVALRLATGDATVAPGQAMDLGVGVYAGPISRPGLREDATTRALGLDGLVRFNFGGPCGFVTFEWLTGLLFWLLHSIHDYLTRDWALAIMLLVVVVRTCLHPLTKWSQIRMQRFGKQMGAMGPKQKQVQERYKDDKKKMQEEMARLWREEGVSPFGALGCLPMFLMTPVWIALYATLYFAFELRHQPAFYGLFQKISGQQWSFLGDLSEPDRLWYFGKTLATLPLVGAVSSINILPLILGVVFFVHQKYLTPPSATTLTPEQESQQKIVKVMTVVMFPVFMYNAPSGLALYFITNSVLGIFENKYIRAHIDEHDLLNPDTLKRKKSGGFMARMQQIAQERAKLMQAQQQGRQPPGGGSRRR